MKNIGEALRLLRVFHDYNQCEMAKKLEISKSYLSEIEAGKKKPRLKTIIKYASFLRIQVSDIVKYAERIIPNPVYLASRQFNLKIFMEIFV